MEKAIQDAIERQAKKLIERHKREQFAAIKYERRFRLRTGKEPIPRSARVPELWTMSPHFNPTYCIKHSKFIAHVIWKKILERTYDVEPAVRFQIRKDGGGHREIMVFSIPDAAVANLFNRRLRDRNKNLQSPFCYSYRQDRTIFDAVLQTSSLLQGDKLYVIQYDFSKYFDSIKHDYIDFVIESGNLFISPAEKYIINKFLTHRFSSFKDYKKNYILGKFDRRTHGTPQGCSLSLFLSNIAAHELDKSLEKSNGMFVRFADDIVCVAGSYQDANKIQKEFVNHCHYSGISINAEKSPGICLMKQSANGGARDYFIDDQDIGKLNTISEFDYIGHKFSRGDVRISDRGVARVKRRLAKIIYLHLLHNPKRGYFSPNRVGPSFYDWDLVTCINEIRSYIYGGLKEEKIRAFINYNNRISRFKGLMSFYPLVTRVEQLAILDGWLVSILRRALKERSKILKDKFQVTMIPISMKDIIDGSWYQYQDGIALETRAPSFVLAWRAARKAFKQYGLTNFEVPQYYSALFESYG